MQNRDILLDSNNQTSEFNEHPIIKVVGVGGGGCNSINRMIINDVQGVEFIAINTDSQDLKSSRADRRIRIGKSLTGGLGAGAKPEIGRKAAEEQADEIKEALRGANMVFIAAGMGGGTGTGAAPVVAKIAKELNTLVVGVVTKPFTYEGKLRAQYANEGIAQLKPYVDTLVIIPNDNVIDVAGCNTTLVEAFVEIDNVLRMGVQGITELITMPSLWNVDFADVQTVLKNSGTALMSIGRGTGANRAIDAVRSAIKSQLLEIDISGATDAIVQVTSDADITLQESRDIMEEIRQASSPDINLIIGHNFNLDLKGELIITLIATGFDQTAVKRNQEKTEEDKPKEDSQISQSNVPSWLRNRI